jgi:hypothetical protein
MRKTANAVPTIFNVASEPPKPVSARILTKMSKAVLTCSLLNGILGRCLTASGFDVVVSVCCSSTACAVAAEVAADCESVVAVCSVTVPAEPPVAVASVVDGKADSAVAGNVFSSFLLESESNAVRPVLAAQVISSGVVAIGASAERIAAGLEGSPIAAIGVVAPIALQPGSVMDEVA